jgi:hypothetical protein
VDDFLRDLRAKGTGDLNAVLSTLNEASLCRQALGFWLEREWITVAPSSPLTALPGPGFSRALTLRDFCGEPAAPDAEEPPRAEAPKTNEDR